MASSDPIDQGARLVQARLARNINDAKAAAKRFGWNYDTYIQHERGDRGIRPKVAEKYARAYRTSASWLLTGEVEPASHVRIIGVAGAGPDGAVQFVDEGDHHLGEAPIPPGGDANSVAIEVRGNSMRGIAENGWLVYYEERRDPPTDDLLGEICVVGLNDGRVLIKRLMRGSRRNHFNLESTAVDTITDVKVAWAAPVSAIVPRRQAQRIVIRD